MMSENIEKLRLLVFEEGRGLKEGETWPPYVCADKCNRLK